ncbi:ABC transporter ATP-binding protein [Paenibacillus contaminans]|uniref:ABC transporter ATP-binding protein n=1 Tax=Paenibacillus contaminans TaxID=450362 RepID=A0A329MHC6_9BACL|nr:ABC transporter ATP-binding protein [Paenibacillus contaminans]RAV19299.1 ABC transporter ATP-binding protein [Paenibacillus contaminans]
MLLQMEQITKTYGELTANKAVDFTLREGEVHAIVGENGAGKTTLMRILYGMEQPTSGAIRIRGKEASFGSPRDAITSGIGMVHQHFMLFSSFTVAENVVIGAEPVKGAWFDRRKAVERVNELSRTYGIPVEPERKAGECSLGAQQRVEILKVLHQGAEIIVLDEPTAVLTPLEVKELLAAIRRLAGQGKSIILITHKLHEVMEVADRITVLRGGQVTGVLEKAETNVEELSRLMVGRELAELNKSRPMPGEASLRVDKLLVRGDNGKPVVDEVSFRVAQGEIVGIAGVSGNGQSELIQSLCGLRRADQGTVALNGRDVTNKLPGVIREAGLAHIPEDRYQWGTAKDRTLVENGLMGHQSKFSRSGVLQKKRIHQAVSDWVQKFGVKTSSVQEKAQNLSGGNLQKLIVARELAQETPFLIAAEPTRGVDIGAMEFIHKQLLDKRTEGGAILLVSSELSEVMKLSDRILVMYEGKIAGELDGHEATEEAISLLMAGGKSKHE